MVANIRSGATPSGALRYNKEKVDKDEAEVLFWQKMLEPFDKYGQLDIDTCMESFWPYLEANRRTTNTDFHDSLNPSPEDRLTDEHLREIAREYMKRMGYGDQSYIIFKHKYIDQKHLHIVSLRVDENGHKLPHDFDARRSMEILRDLECKYDLHPSIKGEEQTDKVELHRLKGRQRQTTDFIRRKIMPAQLQMLVLRRVPHAAGTVQHLGRGAYRNDRRQKLRGHCLLCSDRQRIRHRHVFQVE